MGTGLTAIVLIEVVVFIVLGCALWAHLGKRMEELQREECRKELNPARIVNDFYTERG